MSEILPGTKGLNASKDANGNRMKTIHSNRGPRERRNAARRRRQNFAFVAPILVILSLPAWFLFPPQDIPSESDAVLVIAGASDGRHQLGAQLIEDGLSKTLSSLIPLAPKIKLAMPIAMAAPGQKERPKHGV